MTQVSVFSKCEETEKVIKHIRSSEPEMEVISICERDTNLWGQEYCGVLITSLFELRKNICSGGG